jgi:hypothetical protein
VNVACEFIGGPWDGEHRSLSMLAVRLGVVVPLEPVLMITDTSAGLLNLPSGEYRIRLADVPHVRHRRVRLDWNP